MARVPKYRVALVREGSANWECAAFTGSKDVFERYREEMLAMDREVFIVLMLDGKNKLIGENLVAVGTLREASIHPREVFKPAILANAAAIVVIHNHPSGVPGPSAEDTAVTRRLYAAGNVLGIKLLDHVIIGETEYFSFADARLMEEPKT